VEPDFDRLGFGSSGRQVLAGWWQNSAGHDKRGGERRGGAGTCCGQVGSHRWRGDPNGQKSAEICRFSAIRQNRCGKLDCAGKHRQARQGRQDRGLDHR
jgi:hypothetical protein